MGPHPNDLHGPFLGIDLIYKTVLHVDPAGIRSLKISHQFLKRGRILARIRAHDFKQALSICPQVRRSQFLSVLLRLFCVIEIPAHQLRVLELFESGSAIPLRIESRIPGIESRYRVS
jgi:hypothetical protein